MDEKYVARYDTVVIPILEWVNSNEWMATYQAHASDFYNELEKAFEAPIFEILANFPTLIWARAARCAFDDFLNVVYDSSPTNVLDHYLNEVGPDLAEADVDFLVAFRNSWVSLYTVVKRVPNESVILRDESGGTKQIEDEMLTTALSAGEVAARLVSIEGRDYLAGSILVLSDETLGIFNRLVEGAFKDQMRSVPKYLQKDRLQRDIARQRVQMESGGILPQIWMLDTLTALAGTAALVTEEEPEKAFEATIPYKSNLEPIVELLDAHAELDRLMPKEFLWLWHTDREEPQANLKATVWISGPDIFVEGYDLVHVEAATALLLSLLGDSVGEATIEELNGDVDDVDDVDDLDEDDDFLPPIPLTDEEEDALRKRFKVFLDHQFGSMLDSPLEELKGQVPRELAKTAKGRKQLIKWLESLEAEFQANAEQSGLGDYDFTWIWKELGVEAQRQSGLFDPS